MNCICDHLFSFFLLRWYLILLQKLIDFLLKSLLKICHIPKIRRHSCKMQTIDLNSKYWKNQLQGFSYRLQRSHKFMPKINSKPMEKNSVVNISKKNREWKLNSTKTITMKNEPNAHLFFRPQHFECHFIINSFNFLTAKFIDKTVRFFFLIGRWISL